jgi:hypothetical protein
MIRRRTAEAGFKNRLGCHVFRATGITDYLERDSTLEHAQEMAAQRTTRSSTTASPTRSRSTRSKIPI